MPSAWRPISRSEFDSLVAGQEASLDSDQKAMLDACRVEPWQAIMRRSEGPVTRGFGLSPSAKEKFCTSTTLNGVGTRPE